MIIRVEFQLCARKRSLY